MTWLDFLVLTLAASAVVDVWFNGSLFADWRAFCQAKADDAPEETDGVVLVEEGQQLPWLMSLADRFMPRWVAELLCCDFCLSYHAPWIVALVLFLPMMLVRSPELAFWLRLPVYSLAATRLGNLINAWAPASAKYHND